MVVVPMGQSDYRDLCQVYPQRLCITDVNIRITGIEQQTGFTVFYIITDCRFPQIILIYICIIIYVLLYQ